MGRDPDENDYYDDYMADHKAEADDLLEAFGLFWVSIGRLLQAVGMVLIAHLGVDDQRAPFFRTHFLEELSLTRAAPLVKEIMDERKLLGARDVRNDLRDLGGYRNRLAHDALDFGLDPSVDVWPSLRQRFPFRDGDSKTVEAQDLRDKIAECERLERRMIEILEAVSHD